MFSSLIIEMKQKEVTLKIKSIKKKICIGESFRIFYGKMPAEEKCKLVISGLFSRKIILKENEKLQNFFIGRAANFSILSTARWPPRPSRWLADWATFCGYL